MAAWRLRATGGARHYHRGFRLLLRLNLLVLLVVVLLPFPTRLIAEALTNTSRERVYVTMRGLTLLAIRLLGPPWTRTRGSALRWIAPSG